MITKKYKFTFPASVIKEPIMYKLTKEYNLIPNILRGKITERSAWLEVQIQGKQEDIQKAMEFLKGKGVKVE